MAKVGYYILTDAQAEILDALEISYVELGGLKCVSDWQALIDALDESIWADGEISDAEGAYFDVFSEAQNYLYWSDEGHNWV